MKEETWNHPQNPIVEPNDMDKEYTLEPGDHMFGLYFLDDVAHEELIQASSTPSQHLAKAAKKDKPPKMFKEMVPEEFRDFHDMFSKDSYEKLPDWKPRDHHIDFKPRMMTLPPPAKLFPLSPVEQKELNGIPHGKSGLWMDPPLEVTHGGASLLHQKEGWWIPVSPRLPEIEQHHDQDCIPTSTNL